MLILVCGLPGTGKTTIASLLASKLNAAHLRTDVIRKEMFDNLTYSGEEKQKVYLEMLKRAKGCLDKRTVILDATFPSAKLRTSAVKIAEDNKIPWCIVETIAPESIIRKRLDKRRGDASDANFTHYLEQRKSFEAISEEHIVVDTSKNIENQLNKYFPN